MQRILEAAPQLAGEPGAELAALDALMRPTAAKAGPQDGMPSASETNPAVVVTVSGGPSLCSVPA